MSTSAQRAAQRALKKQETETAPKTTLSSTAGGVTEPRAQKTPRPAPGSPVVLAGKQIPDTGTLTIGCKLPQGLILRVYRMVKTQEPVMGGGIRDIEVAQHTGVQYVLKGTGQQLAKHKSGLPVIGDYEYTHDVPAEFFKEWVRQNHDSDMLKNNLIFWMPNAHAATDRGKEQQNLRTGFEPLNPASPSNPKGDVRIPKPNNPQLTGLEKMLSKGS